MPVRPKGMKTILSLRMMSRLLALGLLGSSVSCMTTYDRTGRPVQTVDPGMAVAGVAAAGIIGYGLANDDDRGRGHYHRPHYRRNYHCR